MGTIDNIWQSSNIVSMLENQEREIEYRVFSPAEAARMGVYPREYVEVAIGQTLWRGVGGSIITATLRRELGGSELIQLCPLFDSDKGIVLSLDRKNGVKATALDYLVYGWNKLKRALPL